MADSWTYILYGVLFFAMYVQVFFLLSFLKNRKTLFGGNEKQSSFNDLPSISIIVPCWNEEKNVVATVDSLLTIKYPKDKLYILVVDDGSTDATWEKMQTFQNTPQVKLFQKENGGKHTALNLALLHTTTELVASIDADTVLDANALIEIVRYFKSTNTAAVGGTVLIGSPSSIAQRAQSVEYQMYSYTKKMFGLLKGVLVVPGAFSVFRTEAIRSVGGYRQGNNLEDLELTFRMQTHKLSVDHCHTAIAYTKGPSSITSLFKQRLRWSRGFLGNIIEYKKTIFNKKFGHFGMFTVPTGIITYFVILYVFVFSWVYMSTFLWQQAVKISLVGFHAKDILSFWKWDPFFFDSRAIAFIIPVLYLFLVFSIWVGNRLSQQKFRIKSFAWFVIIYSFLPPFWIMKSLYYTCRSKMPSWR